MTIIHSEQLREKSLKGIQEWKAYYPHHWGLREKRKTAMLKKHIWRNKWKFGKLLLTNNNEKILKTIEDKWYITQRETIIQRAFFFYKKLWRQKWNSIFEVLKELSTKNSIDSISIFRNKSEIKTFSDELIYIYKKLIKEFAVSRLPLKELLRLIFQTKVNDTRRNLGTSGVKEEYRNNIWQMW